MLIYLQPITSLTMGWFSKNKEVAAAAPEPRLVLKTFTINDEADIMDAVNHLKLGTTIALVKIKSNSVVREALRAMKEACAEVKGDIAGLPDGWFVVVPRTVEIVKNSANAGKQVAEAIITKEQENSLRASHDHLADKLIVVDEFDTF